MTTSDRETDEKTASYADAGFSLALSRPEVRRQMWTCAAISGLILAALLAAALAGTA